MAIVNYAARGERHLARLLEDQQISESNKEALLKFLKTYDVSEARRTIFFERIGPLLRCSSKVESVVHDYDRMCELFLELRQRYSTASYGLYLSVSKRFAGWLNDGETPRALQRIKRPSLSKSRRELSPRDMWSWEEGERTAQIEPSVQLRAMFLCQLDAGFRPSELLGLRYGDVEPRGKMASVYVREGKTGARNVIMYRSATALMQWLQAHPTREPDDPLWVLERADLSWRKNGKVAMSSVRPYTYNAARKQFLRMRNRARIDKKVDFYLLRHSSCCLDKKQNLPLDMAAERHGHSVKFFVEVYGRLSMEDTLERFERHYGIQNTMPTAQDLSSTAAEMVPELPFGAVQPMGNVDMGQLGGQLELLREQILVAARKEIEAKLAGQR